MFRRGTALTVFLLTYTLLSTPSFAVSIPDLSENPYANLPEENSFSAEAGIGQLNEDYYLDLNLRLDLNLGKIGIGIQAPVGILVIDQDPPSRDAHYKGFIKKGQWDELSDYTKIIRYIRYGTKGDPLYFRIGELTWASIGHGTIVSRYYNSLDINAYQMGLALDINTDYGGAETLIDNLTAPELIAGRFYIKPIGLYNPKSIFNRLDVGLTVATDMNAPYKPYSVSLPITEASSNIPSDIKVEDGYIRKNVTILGLDVDYALLNTSLVKLIPYVDYNFHTGEGNGLHAGVMSTFNFPLIVDFQLDARLEYRNFSNYLPAYFDTYYELHRFTYFRGALNTLPVDRSGIVAPPFDSTTIPAPKLYFVRDVMDENARLNGVYGELGFDFINILRLNLFYDDYEGPNNANLACYVSFPAFSSLELNAYYFRSNFDGFSELKRWDDNSLALAELRVKVLYAFWVVARYWRMWEDGHSVSGWSLGGAMGFKF